MKIKEKYFKNNKLIMLPKKEKNKIAVLEIIRNMIEEQGKEYSEKELNTLIKEIYNDFSLIRRCLVDYGMIIRDKYGKNYILKKNKENNS